MVKQHQKGSRYTCVVFAACLLLAPAQLAMAADLEGPGATKWRTVATRPEPFCSFSSATEGEASWDHVSKQFTISPFGQIVLEANFTNINHILITRAESFLDTDSPMSQDNAPLLVNTDAVNEVITTKSGSEVDVLPVTYGGRTNDVAKLDTTDKDPDYYVGISIGGSVGIEPSHEPVDGEVYTLTYTFTCDGDQ